MDQTKIGLLIRSLRLERGLLYWHCTRHGLFRQIF